MPEFQMAQAEAEIDAFIELLTREGVRSYLEIGSKFGGSLWRVGKALPGGSRIVSIDMPKGTRVWGETEASLKACADELRGLGRDVRIIWGNSTDPAMIAEARSCGPYDAILIDADHRLPGVTADWVNYGPMGRIIAFHDIAWRRAPEWEGVRIDVPQFWEGLKRDYRYSEFKFCPTGKNNGIGVLWRS